MSLSKVQRNFNLNRKYLVYHNDLKYRAERDLNKDRIIWDDLKLKYMYDNVDTDSLEYRLLECKKGGLRHLDLNNLDLVTFPEIPEEFQKSIKCLFIAENDLEELPDLTDYKNLEILEIGNNNINDLGRLPRSLLELTCRSNKIRYLPDADECPKISRIDCSMNEITNIPSYSNIKSLRCANNKLKNIPELITLENLICNNNEIDLINSKCVNLRYLDCSNNKLTKISNYPNLIDLICSNNNIEELNIYPQVKYIEIFMTRINIIPYMKCLEEIFCEKNMIKKVSEKYLKFCDIKVKVHKEKMLQITFTKKIV